MIYFIELIRRSDAKLDVAHLTVLGRQVPLRVLGNPCCGTFGGRGRWGG